MDGLANFNLLREHLQNGGNQAVVRRAVKLSYGG